MTADDWARLKLWFGEALAAEPAQRSRIVARLRRDSPPLALELESLLAVHDSHALTTLDLASLSLPAPELRPADRPPGALVGPYRILRELGRGGAGTVFLAERADDEYHRGVALKLLHAGRGTAASPSGLGHERGSLARLQHPNIAVLLDWGTCADGLPWLATEYVPGQPIDAFCRIRRLSEPAILELFAQVGRAVAHAHAHGVVHRDLKPGNILVNPDGMVKLLDFGIAHLAETEPDHSTALRFTPFYASPEQLRGQPATPASDVYSLAVVLGQLLSGALPPDFARLPPGLMRILRHALDQDPARRYPSVALLQADLARYARHQPPREIPTAWPRRALLFLRRHPWGLSLAALAAAAASLGYGLWPTLPPGPRRPSPAIVFSRLPLHDSQTMPLRVVWRRPARVQSVTVVTQGVPNLDFTSPDPSACVGAFAAGASCTLHVRFSPTTGDKRLGAVIFRAESGQTLNTLYMAGVGASGSGWLAHATPERIISGLNFARGLSTDGAGNAYFIEARGNTVDELPTGSARVRVVARLPLPLQGGATAVDGAGNLYFSSTAAHAIYRLDNGVPTLIANVPADTLLDDNLVVDAAGNLFTTGELGAIYRINAGSRRTVQIYPPGQGRRFVGLDVDSDGSLYAPDYLSGALDELPVGVDRLIPLLPPGRLDHPHAILSLMDGALLVGEDIPDAHVIRYSLPQYSPAPLAAMGNQSLAVFGQSRLFAVVNNSQVRVYRLAPAPRP